MAILRNDFLACEYLESLGILSVLNGQGGRLRGESDEKWLHCCFFFDNSLMSIIIVVAL